MHEFISASALPLKTRGREWKVKTKKSREETPREV